MNRRSLSRDVVALLLGLGIGAYLGGVYVSNDSVPKEHLSTAVCADTCVISAFGTDEDGKLTVDMDCFDPPRKEIVYLYAPNGEEDNGTQKAE